MKHLTDIKQKIGETKKTFIEFKKFLANAYHATIWNFAALSSTMAVSLHEQALDYMKEEVEILLIRFTPESSSENIFIGLLSQILINVWQKYIPAAWHKQ